MCQLTFVNLLAGITRFQQSPRGGGLTTIVLREPDSNQIPTGTSRLSGRPYRHQGLSSVVGTVGIEPTWDLLTFQPRIRRRVYVPYCIFSYWRLDSNQRFQISTTGIDDISIHCYASLFVVWEWIRTTGTSFSHFALPTELPHHFFVINSWYTLSFHHLVSTG